MSNRQKHGTIICANQLLRAGFCSVSAVILLFCSSQEIFGETFRLSKVVAESVANSERVELNQDGMSEILFIEKQAVVTGADVKSAMRFPGEENALAVTLTEEGGMKLGAATENAQGNMRIAILIEDKVVSAPFVMVKLGNNFLINGLEEFPDDDLDLLGWQIEGRSDEEIATRLREKRAVPTTAPKPPQEPEYYSDVEYALLKKEREKIGMFYLDELPTEAQLDQRLKVGMTQADVISKFGKATRTQVDEEGKLESLEYDLAPEKRSFSDESRPDAFAVRFINDTVSRWGINCWTDAPREPKPQGKNLRTVPWIEKVELSLQPGQQMPHAQDYADLISMIHNIAITADENSLIEANCSVVITLAEGFPEAEVLRKSAQNGEISLLKLNNLLKPYFFGQKPFPETPPEK
jgi:hypothetical protein